MRSVVCKQPGKGLSDGVTCEVAAFFDVLPGHQEELRAATWRFTEAIRNLDPAIGIRVGLRDTRHVIFDNGFRLLWCASFEGDWDAWADDGLFLIGVDHFLDWVRHTAQGGEPAAGAQLPAILQSAQAQAVAYFSPLSTLTLPQIVEAQRLDVVARQALGNPFVEEALQHPALEPLSRQIGRCAGAR
jgi:hypothetical protein